MSAIAFVGMFCVFIGVVACLGRVEQIIGLLGKAVEGSTGVGDLRSGWLVGSTLRGAVVQVRQQGDQYVVEILGPGARAVAGLPWATQDKAIASAEVVRRRVNEIVDALGGDGRVIWRDGPLGTNYPGP